MLFNSYEFCLLFLPLCLIVYRAAGRYQGQTFAVAWLLLASIIFYAWSSTTTLVILGASILLNYGFARLLTSLRDHADPRRGWIAGIAVAANLAILAQYKYMEFLVEAGAAMMGIDMPLVRAIPPLAISFFTFQQIAYLVDVHRGHTAERNLLRYGLFVSFFPQLIAGPIVHHKDMLWQFSRSHSESNARNMAVGLTLFSIGLFKKVVVADTIVDWVHPVFVSPTQATLSALDAWLGTLAYTLQLYFDFSGYCDMAIGLGLMIGFRLPLNFDSPYQATSIIDFWRRWHMTLSRFLRDYLYFGLGGNRRGQVRRYANLMVTMLLGGLWHGANWTFLAWGVLHGMFLMINHAWRGIFALLGRDVPNSWGYRVGYRLTTLLGVMVAWVFFRADSFAAAIELIGVMCGLNSAGATGLSMTTVPEPVTGLFDWIHAAVLLGLLGVVSIAPNSQQIVGYAGIGEHRRDDVRARNASDRKTGDGRTTFGAKLPTFPSWSPSASWAAVTALLCLLSLASMSEARDFVYFRF